MTAIDEIAEELEPLEEASERRTDSFLIAEIGAANTSATFFDVSGGSYQILSQASSLTTGRPPWSDVRNGLFSAINQIESMLERPLLNRFKVITKPSKRDGSGVDFFGTVVSAAPPLKTLIVGLLEDVSLSSGRRALHSIYSREVDCFSLADKRSQEEQLQAMIQGQPDLVFIVGGTDGGADSQLMRFIDTVALGVQALAESHVPTVIFAGNREIQPKVAQKLGEYCDLVLAENVRPSLESENYDQVIALLGDLYATHQIRNLPGFSPLVDWSDFPIIPTAHGFGAICEFYASLQKGRVLGVDVGGSSITIVAAEPDHVYIDVNSELGLGEPLRELWKQVDIDELSTWAGLAQDQERVLTYVANKAVRPNAVPVDKTENNIELAIAREILKTAASQAYERWNWSSSRIQEPTKTLILRGSIMANAGNVRRMVAMVQDTVQATGTFDVVVDRFGVLPKLGLLAVHEPRLVVQILEGKGKENLGWVISPTISARDGEILRLKIAIDNQESIHKTINKGDIEVIPIGINQEAEVTAEPSPRTDIGEGPGNSRTLNIRGGQLGLLIDARGKPAYSLSSKNGGS